MTQRWADAHRLFRAVVAAADVSPRAHRLTTALIALNAANYSAWAWRWRCAAAALAAEEVAAAGAGAGEARAQCADASAGGSACLAAELRYTEELAQSSAKNYQLWCAGPAAPQPQPLARLARAQLRPPTAPLTPPLTRLRARTLPAAGTTGGWWRPRPRRAAALPAWLR